MEKTIIRFYDNEDYNYPLLECYTKDIEKIRAYLKEYQQKDTYNFDDFISNLEDKGFDIRVYSYDVEWFF